MAPANFILQPFHSHSLRHLCHLLDMTYCDLLTLTFTP